MKHVFLLPAVLLFLTACLSAPAAATNVAPAKDGTVDDSEAGWTWSGLVEYDDPDLHGGTGHAGGPGSYAVYTFHGTGIDVYGMGGPTVTVDGRKHRMGSMKISIDGHVKALESMQRPDATYNIDAFTETGLPDANHVLQIDADGGWIVVDAIRIHASSDSDTAPEIDTASKSKPKAGPLGIPVEMPEGDYRIYSRIAPNSDVDDKDWLTTDGNPLQLWTNGNRQANQWFHVTPLGHGKYWMAPQVARNEAMTMLVPQNDNTVPLGVWNYTAHPAQIWYVTDVGDGWCRITPSNAQTLAVTIFAGQSADGSRLVCDTWKLLPHQEWAFGIQ